jgi:hypothetical protein
MITNAFLVLTFESTGTTHPHTMPSGGLLAFAGFTGYTKFVREVTNLPLLVYTKTVPRLSYSKNHRLSMNKPHTPNFWSAFFF